MTQRKPAFTPAFAPAADSAVDRHRYIHVIGSSVWVTEEAHETTWPTLFLGMLDDMACWGVDVPHGEDPADGAALDLFSYYGRATEVEWAVAGRAVQLAEWQRTHRFCGRCATPTESSATDRAMRCPECGLLAYPRLAPAMITLVTRGDEALLARGAQFRAPMYSCLAGFVEAGESLEEAVVREVREEVGVEVGNVRYVSSQPWPFPHSLMIGFHAEWQSGDIVCEPTEILDAQWYTRDALPNIPPRISIARRLIDAWVEGEIG